MTYIYTVLYFVDESMLGWNKMCFKYCLLKIKAFTKERFSFYHYSPLKTLYRQFLILKKTLLCTNIV